MGLVLCLALVFGFTSTAFAEENNRTESSLYEEIIIKYNQMYDVDLEYVHVERGTNLENYETFIAETAKYQRDTLNYIEERLQEDLVDAELFAAPRAITTTTKTATKAATISATIPNGTPQITFKYYVKLDPNASPNKWVETISGEKPTAKIKQSSAEMVICTLDYIQNSWSSSSLDARRTLAITTTGTLNKFYSGQPPMAVSGVKLYAEFSY